MRERRGKKVSQKQCAQSITGAGTKQRHNSLVIGLEGKLQLEGDRLWFPFLFRPWFTVLGRRGDFKLHVGWDGTDGAVLQRQLSVG